MKHYGISEEEAKLKRGSYDLYGDWQKLHSVSLRQQPNGTIGLASYPTDVGRDLMMGSRLEIELFPDGTYCAEISPQWTMLPKREGRIGKAAHEDGCYLHPSCFECPEIDCRAKDYLLVSRGKK